MTHLPLAEPVQPPHVAAMEHQKTRHDHCVDHWQESEACVHLKSLESEVCFRVKLGLSHGIGASSLDLEVLDLEMGESGHESEVLVVLSQGGLAAEEVLKLVIEASARARPQDSLVLVVSTEVVTL